MGRDGEQRREWSEAHEQHAGREQLVENVAVRRRHTATQDSHSAHVSGRLSGARVPRRDSCFFPSRFPPAGAEVVRLLAPLDEYRITAMTGDSQAGKDFSDVFPHLVRKEKMMSLSPSLVPSPCVTPVVTTTQIWTSDSLSLVPTYLHLHPVVISTYTQ